MNRPLVFAWTAGLRTAMQTAAGTLATLQLAGLNDLGNFGENLLLVGIGALLSGLIAFLQNYAEQIQVPE